MTEKKPPLSDEDKAQIEAKRATTAEVVDNDTGEISELAIDTLSGDLRDAMLMRVRDMKRPWSMLTEDEQRDLANGLDIAARDLTRAAVRLVTAHEWPSAVVTLHDIKIIGGDKARIEGKVVADNITHNREVLGDHVNTMVKLVCVDSVTLMGEREPVKIDPDQSTLPVDDDGEGDESDAAA